MLPVTLKAPRKKPNSLHPKVAISPTALTVAVVPPTNKSPVVIPVASIIL